MDGHLGIPVFYMNGLERHTNRFKSLVSGSSRKEKPFFFNYEDLQNAWEKTKKPTNYKYNPDSNSNQDVASTTTSSATTDANGVELNDEELDKLLPPNSVEVFNLWDVVTSMEREHFKRESYKQQTLSSPQQLWKNICYPIQNRFHNVVKKKKNNNNDSNIDSINNPLDSIVFIPSSDAISYKESMSTRGNGEARLRPMRGEMTQPRGGNGSLFGVL